MRTPVPLIRRGRIALIAAASLALLFPAVPAQAARPENPPGLTLEQHVSEAVSARIGKTPETLAAEGRTSRITVQRRDATRDWAFGTAVLRTPQGAEEFPRGWLFLAERGETGWTVTLDRNEDFADMAQRAPASILSQKEKTVFRSWEGDVSPTSGGPSPGGQSNNTGLRLPYAQGHTWTMTGGPHGWSGSSTPYNSIDLAGGDLVVRTAYEGTVYTMCASTESGIPGGWRRVYHGTGSSSGYVTDYYHLWYLTPLAEGSAISNGTQLGVAGTNLCAGGSASGRHVHWTIHPPDGSGLHWKSAGRWVFWVDSGNPYGGYALHGSTAIYPGGGLTNYGRLARKQGIVDTWGGGVLNVRTGPGTGYEVVGSVPDGNVYSITCWDYGTYHTGRYGGTSIWNRIKEYNGIDDGWVSDAYMYTGNYTTGSQC